MIFINFYRFTIAQNLFYWGTKGIKKNSSITIYLLEKSYSTH